MKTILSLFKKAFGWPLFVWFGIFILWNAFVGYYEGMLVAQGRELQNVEAVQLVVHLIGILLMMCFLGYFFCVAGRVASNTPKPLRPINFKNSFIMGIRVVFRLILLNLPLLAILEIGIWLNTPEVVWFCNYYTLFYIVFAIVPYFLYFVANIERFPLWEDVWPFFKKNANSCFAFVLCNAFSYVIWFNITEAIFNLGRIYSTTLPALVGFVLTPYFLLCYTIFLNAVLLGYFAGKTKEVPNNKPIKEVVVEEKKEPTKKASLSNKKPPIKKTVKRKNIKK